jgi:hypothetical protein
VLPIVVASASAAARRPAINRRLPADAWFFPFDIRWRARKGNGHCEASIVEKWIPP